MSLKNFEITTHSDIDIQLDESVVKISLTIPHDTEDDAESIAMLLRDNPNLFSKILISNIAINIKKLSKQLSKQIKDGGLPFNETAH